MRPAPVSEDRRARMTRGRDFHRRIAWILGTPEEVEVAVAWRGIRGKVDLLQALPLEIKTTQTLPSVEQLSAERSDAIEQLGAYSALLGRPGGRLLFVRPEGGRVGAVQLLDVDFDEREAIRSELEARAVALRSAWASGSAAGLPGCVWKGRGCEYEAAHVCDCEGTRIAPEPLFSLEYVRVRENPAEAGVVADRLRSGWATVDSCLRGIRDLLYPRRTYFERRAEGDAPSAFSTGPMTSPIGPDGFRRVMTALTDGAAEDLLWRPVHLEGPMDRILCFRGDPLLVRGSQARPIADAGELRERCPQYLLELGFRCALTGRDSGRLLIVNPPRAAARPTVTVWRARVDPITTFARLWRSRYQALRRAILSGSFDALDPCASWMCAACPYRPACGCAGAEASADGFDQR